MAKLVFFRPYARFYSPFRIPAPPSGPHKPFFAAGDVPGFLFCRPIHSTALFYPPPRNTPFSTQGAFNLVENRKKILPGNNVICKDHHENSRGDLFKLPALNAPLAGLGTGMLGPPPTPRWSPPPTQAPFRLERYSPDIPYLSSFPLPPEKTPQGPNPVLRGLSRRGDLVARPLRPRTRVIKTRKDVPLGPLHFYNCTPCDEIALCFLARIAHPPSVIYKQDVLHRALKLTSKLPEFPKKVMAIACRFLRCEIWFVCSVDSYSLVRWKPQLYLNCHGAR